MINHDVRRRVRRTRDAAPLTFRPFTGLLAAGLLTASSAFAALPESLDRVPTDALATVVAPSVDRLDKNAAALLAAVEMPAVASPAQLLSVVGLSRGVDTAKPLALVLMAGDLGGEVPPALLLLPVREYAAVAQSLGATDTSGAIASGAAAGEQVYIKQVQGGYAAISPMRSILEKFTGDGGLLGAHEKNLGAMGVRLVENSDVAVIANIPALAPMLEPGLAQMQEQMRMFTAMQGGMQGLENNPGEQMVRSVLRDGKTGVLGLKASGMGLTASVATTFKEGSELARMFEGGGDASPLLARLPDAPFLFAYAVDLSSPVARTFLAKASEMREQAAAPGMQPAPEMPGVMALVENLAGQAGMVMPNPAGFMGGLLARGVYYYESPSPDAVIDGYRRILTDLNGKTINGLSYSGVFNADSTTVNSKKVSGYSLRMQAAPGSMAAGMGMIYGPSGGPSGFMGKAGQGVVVTTSPDQALMATALNAAEGKSALNANAMVKQVQTGLPSGRVFEMYISPRPILDQVMPLLAMLGQPLDAAAVPAQLPPVGLSASADGGAVRFDLFVPAPVIKTGVALGQSVQGMMGGARGGEQNADNPPF